MAYDEAADKDSWQQMQLFFEKIFRYLEVRYQFPMSAFGQKRTFSKVQ